jgi:serine/threonine-protein kinase
MRSPRAASRPPRSSSPGEILDHETIVIGRTVFHYQILEKLGAGGMGVVYRARDIKLDRDVVLKFLPPSLTADEDATRRQVQEAKAASALDHPNICTIYGLEGTDEGQAFISMAYYQGEVLRDRIRRGPLPVENAADIARQVARGLSAAHAKGIIHRDIKPANIIVTGDGVVKILDFGVAKLAGAGRITQSGMTVGTAAYISPEQLSGLPVDRRTDIWSLGAVLYEMVTGVQPFRTDRDESLLLTILTVQPRPMRSFQSEVPEGLERIVKKCMAKDAAGRYADTNEMLAQLEPFARPSASPVSSTGMTRPALRPARRRRNLAAAAAVGAVVLAGGGALLWQRGRSSRARAPAPPVSDSSRGVPAAGLKRLAVLPFENLRSDPATDYLAYALADRLTERLGYVKGIVVRPSSAARDYQSRNVDAAAVGAKLRVDYLLTGGFSGDQQRVRLDLELVNVRSGNKIAQEPVEVRYEDSFRLQDIAAEKVIRGLALDLPRGKPDPAATDVPRNPLAYEQYLRSLSYPQTQEGHQLALGMLEKSIALDSGYAPAYEALASRLRQIAIYSLGGKSTHARAEEAFKKALSLNGELLGARSGLAFLYTEIGETDKAIGLLRDVLKTNPTHAQSHFSLSYAYRYAGMLKESAQEGETALALDPNNPTFRSLATTYLYLGDYDRALSVHKLDPDSPWTLAREGQIYLRRGQTKLALDRFDRAIEREPESSTGRWAVAMKAHLTGRREEGLAALRRSEERGMVDGEQRYHFANIHCLLGDAPGCIRGLAEAVSLGFFNYPFMQRDALLDPVRSDPRFQRILADAKARHETFRARFFPGAGPHAQLTPMLTADPFAGVDRRLPEPRAHPVDGRGHS